MGVLILSFLIILLSVVTAFSSPPSPEKISSTKHSQITSNIQRSQIILRALYLEHRHQYVESRNIWKTLPQTNKSVKDHIFQADLMDQKPGVLESIPETVSSILIAVSYYNWQKKWDKGYQLLKKHPDIVAKSEELKLIEVRLALYLRKYEEAELLLLGMAPQDLLDKTKLRLLRTWYFVLSGKKKGFRIAIKELEEDSLYLPASLMMIAHWGESWSDTKKRALKALTRFPSNRKLIEEIIIIFQNHGAWNELGDLLDLKTFNRDEAGAWVLTANVYFQTGQAKKLRQLLNTVRKTERHRLDYLDYAARIAVRRKEWDLLKHVTDQYHKYFPYLRDGDLFLAEYKRETASRKK